MSRCSLQLLWPKSLDREIIFNDYFRRELWLHQPSQHKRVTKKGVSWVSNGVGWGICIKSGICSSAWRKDTLGPLGEIHPMLQHVTRSRGWNITETSWIAMSVMRLNQVWRYQWSNLGYCKYHRSKRNKTLTFTVTTKFLCGNTHGSSRSWMSRSDRWSFTGEESR
jgi:hypothetical protein